MWPLSRQPGRSLGLNMEFLYYLAALGRGPRDLEMGSGLLHPGQEVGTAHRFLCWQIDKEHCSAMDKSDQYPAPGYCTRTLGTILGTLLNEAFWTGISCTPGGKVCKE